MRNKNEKVDVKVLGRTYVARVKSISDINEDEKENYQFSGVRIVDLTFDSDDKQSQYLDISTHNHRYDHSSSDNYLLACYEDNKKTIEEAVNIANALLEWASEAEELNDKFLDENTSS